MTCEEFDKWIDDGASLTKNVCACAMDLARYNKMTMGELFEKYEGH